MDKNIKVGSCMTQIIGEIIMVINCNYNGDRHRKNFGNQHYEIYRSRSNDRLFRGNNRRNNRIISNSRPRSGSKVSTNRDRIRCFKCQEYDHFMINCLTTHADRQVEQFQQMFNMDEGQTLLQTPLIDTNEVRQSVNTTEARKHLTYRG